MKKTIVAAVSIAFALSAAVASAATTYTRDLTMGSTGADVVSLQTTLESKGFLVIPAGVSKGYYGSLTASALAKYQASVGIAPAVGYFGPITRAHFNAMTDGGDDDNGDDSDDNDDDLSGGEGDIKDYDVLGNPSSTDLDQGETDAVIGFEFEAEDSDLRVERLEITASSSAASPASRDPWDYIESAVLMMGDDEVAEVSDLDDEDSWDEESGGDIDDTYTFRFEDIDAVVEEGETAKFYVEFTAVDNLDSDDEDTEFDVAVSTDGLRVVDAEGIDIYEGTVSDETTVTFEGAEEGDLEVSLDEDDNEDRVVFVDEDSETESVEIMRFTVEGNASENVIDELQVKLATSTATNTAIAEVVTNLRLEIDGDEISSESVPAGTGTSTVTFEDLEDDFIVGEDEEVEVVILADIDSQEGNYGEGYEFYAYVPGSGFEVEDSEGDDVTVTDNVTGGEIELRVDGLSIEFVSASENRTNGENAGEGDTVELKIVFEVSANGDDVYLDGDTTATTTPTTHSSTDGVAWASSTDATGISTTTATTAIVTPNDGYKSSDTNSSGDKRLKVTDGNTRTFTLTVTQVAGEDNAIGGARITGFKWDTTSQDAMSNLYNVDLEEFRTDIVTGLNVR